MLHKLSNLFVYFLPLFVKAGLPAGQRILLAMRILPLCREALLCFLVSLVFSGSSCYGGDKNTVEVVGAGECSDCVENKIKTSHAFSGKSNLLYSGCVSIFYF